MEHENEAPQDEAQTHFPNAFDDMSSYIDTFLRAVESNNIETMWDMLACMTRVLCSPTGFEPIVLLPHGIAHLANSKNVKEKKWKEKKRQEGGAETFAESLSPIDQLLYKNWDTFITEPAKRAEDSCKQVILQLQQNSPIL